MPAGGIAKQQAVAQYTMVSSSSLGNGGRSTTQGTGNSGYSRLGRGNRWGIKEKYLWCLFLILWWIHWRLACWTLRGTWTGHRRTCLRCPWRLYLLACVQELWPHYREDSNDDADDLEVQLGDGYSIDLVNGEQKEIDPTDRNHEQLIDHVSNSHWPRELSGRVCW